MCLLFLEIAMLLGGIYAIVTAKVPSFLVGGGKVQIEGTNARLFGVLLASPLPLALLGAFILTMLFGGEGTAYASLLELGIVLGVAILAIVLARVMGVRVEATSNVEATIAKKAQGALMYALFSAFGVTAPFVCPLAFVYANQALKLIEEHGVGEQYRGKAKTARVIAAGAVLFWLAVVAFILILSATL